MRKYLIATHGTFSAGVKSSLEMIIGVTENVFIIQAYVDGNTVIENEIKAILARIGNEDELIVFSDILGGSVTNQLLHHSMQPNVHIISGFNLPLLIDVFLGDADTPVNELIENAIINAKEQMVYVNKLINSESK
ncbi:MAG: fructoselysine/glucoselysine system component [Mucilaginibacter sp.]|nr:fructoselysine/glucoselysine system component [Mucilaginibacter sp.]